MTYLDDETLAALAANRVRFLRNELAVALEQGDAARYEAVKRELDELDVAPEKIAAVQDEAAAKVAEVLEAEDAQP